MKTREELRDIAQEAVLQIIENNDFKGLINVAPRFGKSPICIRAIGKVPNLQKALWVDIDADSRDIHIPAEFEKFGFSHLLPQTKFICFQSLAKEMGNYDIIILNEYQGLTFNNCVSLLNGSLSSKRIIGATATQPKGSLKRYILSKLGLREIAYLSIDGAAEAGIINNYNIHIIKFDLDNVDTTKYTSPGGKKAITEAAKYNSLTLGIEFSKQQGADYSFLVDFRRRVLYSSIARLEMVKQIKESLKTKRVLSFLPYKYQVESLGEYYHSTSGNQFYKLFKDKAVNHLALIKAGSVGHTYEDIDSVIIGQITKDVNGFTTQAWARGLTFREGLPVDIYILVAKDTVEEEWLKSTLNEVDVNKIKYYG